MSPDPRKSVAFAHHSGRVLAGFDFGSHLWPRSGLAMQSDVNAVRPPKGRRVADFGMKKAQRRRSM
jgi:hypothetical protein